MSKSDHIIVFDDLCRILDDFSKEDMEKLRRIFNGEGIRMVVMTVTAVWKCPLCFANDKTMACFCSQDEIEEYKKKPHHCPRCQRSKGIEVGMVLVGSNK